MKLRFNLKLVLGGLMLAGLAACGGGGGGSDITFAGASNGTLRVALTDAPACGYDAVNVTIQKVRVHQSSSASDTASGWSEVVLNPARRVDLLTLTNGVLDELGQTPLPTGKYTQLRLVLADNDSAHPLANSVVPTGGTETALKTPSGQQSGVKTNINIDIAANKMADFVLDFDACKSVVVAGNSGQYLLKPVVTVIPRYVSGVTGFVDATLVNGSTSVSLQQGGVVIKATTPGTQRPVSAPAGCTGQLHAGADGAGAHHGDCHQRAGDHRHGDAHQRFGHRAQSDGLGQRDRERYGHGRRPGPRAAAADGGHHGGDRGQLC